MKSPKNNVCCRNIAVIVDYCRRYGVGEEALLKQLSFTPEFLLDTEHWVPLSVFTTIIKRAKKALGDPLAPYKMGLSAAELQSWGTLAIVQRILATSFFGPATAFTRVPGYNKNFNDTKEVELVKLSKTDCLIKIAFHDDVEPTTDYDSGAFICGLLSSLPQIWGLPPAEVSERLLQYRLATLFTKIFPDLGKPRIRNGVFYLGRIRFGRQIELLPDQRRGQPVYLGRYREVSKKSIHPIGVMIERPLEAQGAVILEPGQIFEAPYFILQARWQSLSLRERFRNLSLGSWLSRRAYLEGLEQEINTIQKYTKELESLVEQRTAELTAAQKELTIWKRKASQVLYSHVPKPVAEAMVKRRLIARESIATILFLDLSGFTSHMSKLDAETVAEQLRQFFSRAQETIESSGWISKYLGDGLMAVFGGLTRSDDPHRSARLAVLTALKLHQDIADFPWKLRVGIETGPVLLGEIGPTRDRRFDCLGQVVNVAKRLEEEAPPGGILIGSQAAALIGKELPINRVGTKELKGVGEISIYTIDPSPRTLEDLEARRLAEVKKVI